MGVEILGSVAGMLLGPVVSSVFSNLFGKKTETAQVQVQEPIKPPQAAAAPDVAPLKTANIASAAAEGPSSTLLTGAGGVSPGTTNLGKNLLLGA